MFHYSFSTILMAMIATNIIIILLSVCFRKTQLMVDIGYKSLAIFTILALLRFILPFEFPITITVAMPVIFSDLVVYIRHHFISFDNFTLSFWNLFEIIWFTGIFALLIKYIYYSQKTSKYIALHGKNVTFQEPYHSLLQQLCYEKKIKKHFGILEVPGISSPMLYGVFSPRILIPTGLILNKKDWYYILNHEVNHYLHHDLLLKQLVYFICIFYWWNPFSHILRKQVDSVLEMRIDNSVANNKDEAFLYLNCLVRVKESVYSTNSHISFLFPTSFITLLPTSSSQIEQRFHMLLKSKRKSAKIVRCLFSALIVCIYILSYCVIFEAYYISTEVEKDSLSISNGVFYAIYNEDSNSYDIYWDNILTEDTFIETTDSLKQYPNIIIKNRKE